MRPKVISVADAVAMIPDGARLMIGGFMGVGSPMRLIDELLRQARSDLTLIVNAGNAAKVPMPVAAVAREAFSMARSHGYGGKDFSSIVDVLCDIAQIDKPRLNT